MRPLPLGFAFALATSLTGCTVVESSPNGPVDSPPPITTNDPVYHVLANAQTVLPDGDIGYLITANGNGGYQLAWTDTKNLPDQFSGTISTNGTFEPSVRGLSGAEDIQVASDLRSLSFSSTPGSNVDGVELVSSTDPIYIDMMVNGERSGFSVYFTAADTEAVENVTSPAAFTSP